MNTPLPPAVMQALQKATHLVQGGRPAEADAFLAQVSIALPPSAEIFQVRGVARRLMGDAAGAVAFLKQAVALKPGHAPFHNSLGAALRASGDISAAEGAFRAALDADPAYADAAYNLGLALGDQARDPEAKAALNRAIALNPRHATAHDALSAVLKRLGETEAAIAAGREAVRLAPASVSALHNLALALTDRGETVEAEALFRKVLAQAPQSSATLAGLGQALWHQGRTAEAEAAFMAAIAADPAALAAHKGLSELRWQQGAAETYLAAYPEAIRRRPQDPGLRLAYARELLRTGDHAGAADALAHAAREAPGDPGIADALARVAIASGDLERALVHHREAIAKAPGVAQYAREHVSTLLRLRRWAEAIDETRAGLARVPDDQALLGYQTVALRLEGDAAYRRIADYDALPMTFDIAPPPGFGDVASFNAALAERLRAMHTARAHPTDQTLRGGTQTYGPLFRSPDPLIQALKGEIEKAVAAFIARMDDDAEHPLFRRKSARFRFAGSWSARLRCEGFHTNHVHPEGWISSAYYVALPPDVADTQAKPGWFKMGETNLGLEGHEKIERYVQPQPGRLVLFPSYFWHGTVPFTAGEERLTVAFDVVPE